MVLRKPEVTLSCEVECDLVYVVAGHKGHPEAVRKEAGGRVRLIDRSHSEAATQNEHRLVKMPFSRAATGDF